MLTAVGSAVGSNQVSTVQHSAPMQRYLQKLEQTALERVFCVGSVNGHGGEAGRSGSYSRSSVSRSVGRVCAWCKSVSDGATRPDEQMS